MQYFACTADAPLMRDNPKIKQMMVVQPVHGDSFDSLKKLENRRGLFKQTFGMPDGYLLSDERYPQPLREFDS
jgi:hypothetical protein